MPESDSSSSHNIIMRPLITIKKAMTGLFARKIKSQTELIEKLRTLSGQKIIEPPILAMIEGLLGVPNLKVKDVMVPRPNMSVLPHSATLDEILPIVLETAHSRFPVIGENMDDIKGILLAKDLLAYSSAQDPSPTFNIRDVLREAVIIPEHKRLDTLLEDFKRQRHR